MAEFCPIAAAGTERGLTTEVQMADGLIPKPPGLGAEAAVRPGPCRVIPPAAGLVGHTTWRRDSCCRFAADAETADRRRNCLLRLAAGPGAGSVCIDRRPGSHTASRDPRAACLKLPRVARSCSKRSWWRWPVACIRQMTEQFQVGASAPKLQLLSSSRLKCEAPSAHIASARLRP